MAALDEINQKMGRGTVTLGRPSKHAARHLALRTPDAARHHAVERNPQHQYLLAGIGVSAQRM